MAEKTWSDDMGEISGFGGSYEGGCRAMVLAGIAWIDTHPDADLQFQGFKNVFGVVTEKSPDAEALTQAMMDARVVGDDGRGNASRSRSDRRDAPCGRQSRPVFVPAEALVGHGRQLREREKAEA